MNSLYNYKALINGEWHPAIIKRERPDIYEIELVETRRVVGLQKSCLKPFKPIPRGIGPTSPVVARFRAIHYDELQEGCIKAAEFLDADQVLVIEDFVIYSMDRSVKIEVGTADIIKDEFIEEHPAWTVAVQDPHIGNNIVARISDTKAAVECFTKTWYGRKVTVYFDTLRMHELKMFV
jgi:hypothetical protein